MLRNVVMIDIRQEICDKVLDDFLSALKFAPDCLLQVK